MSKIDIEFPNEAEELKTPYASMNSAGVIRLGKEVILQTDIDDYSYARAGKQKDNEEVLYLVLFKEKVDDARPIRNDRSRLGKVISATRLYTKLSYETAGRKFKVTQTVHEGNRVLVLTLIPIKNEE